MQSRLWPLLAGALGALCLAPTIASADVARPPPRDCPYGSFGVVGRHTSGTYCRYESCETDEDCAGRYGRRDLVCRPSAVCTEVRTVRFFADRMHTRTRQDIQQIGHAECADAPCAAGTCTRGRFCVPGGEARQEEPPEPDVSPNPAPELAPADDPPEPEDDPPEAESEEGPATAADPTSNGPDTPGAASGSGLCSASPAPGPRVAGLLGLAVVALFVGKRRAR